MRPLTWQTVIPVVSAVRAVSRVEGEKEHGHAADDSDHKEVTSLFSASLPAAESRAVAWRWGNASQSCRCAVQCVCCFLFRSTDKK